MTPVINNMCETGEWSRDFIEVTVIAIKKKPEAKNALTITQSALWHMQQG